MATPVDIHAALDERRPGATLDLVLLRHGERRTAGVTLGREPDSATGTAVHCVPILSAVPVSSYLFKPPVTGHAIDPRMLFRAQDKVYVGYDPIAAPAAESPADLDARLERVEAQLQRLAELLGKLEARSRR